jgi:hypothetical protein
MMRNFVFLLFVFSAGLGLSGFEAARAHSASTAWLHTSVSNRVAQVDVQMPLRDLDDVLGLDADNDGLLTWGELRRRTKDVERMVRAGLRLVAGPEVLSWEFAGLQVVERLDTPCAALRLTAAIPDGTGPLVLEYDLFFDRDPLHRCLVGGMVTTVLSPDQRRVELRPVGGDLATGPARMSLGTFVREGMHHIWTGYDHLAFLLVLLLPAVLLRTPEGWRGVPDLKGALGAVLKVVTAFTLAHSLTLGLAAFDVVRLPPRWVEATIAASIVVAAVLAWTESRSSAAAVRRSWMTAFGFGLIHGFGFAGVLGELGLGREGLAGPLFGFNLGVELGQLVCVAVFLPVAFLMRGTWVYRRLAWPAGTMAVVVAAGGWFVERTFDMAFMPF